MCQELFGEVGIDVLKGLDSVLRMLKDAVLEGGVDGVQGLVEGFGGHAIQLFPQGARLLICRVCCCAGGDQSDGR